MLNWATAPDFGRTKILKLVLELLHSARKENIPVTIVETGTTRGDLGGGVELDGWATTVFGWYCYNYNGRLYTIDMSKEAIDQCRFITHDYKDSIEYLVGDSVEILKNLDVKVDLLYLDSSDDPVVILNEVKEVYNKLNEDALIVLDDTYEQGASGKGALVYKCLTDGGWKRIASSASQVVLVRDIVTIYDNWYGREQFRVEDTIKLDISDYDAKAQFFFDFFSKHLPDKSVLPVVCDQVRVLDLGCNTGYNTAYLKSKYGTAVGVDFNPMLILASAANDVKCYTMDISKLDFPSESFSMVVAKDVLEHSNSPDAVLGEVYRVLVDKGQFIAFFPLDGEILGKDDVILHPSFNFGNTSHVWKATLQGVLRRLISLGFTDLAVDFLDYKKTFGEDRDFGNKFLLILATKRKDIIKIPYNLLRDGSYIAAFLTFRCTGNCSYCIQKLCKGEFDKAVSSFYKNELPPSVWIDFLSKMQRFNKHPLSLIGGEPTLYKGLLDIINSLPDYYITVTTNLTSPLMSDIKTFVSKLTNRNIRINTSFHPQLSNVEEFSNKVKDLRDAGIKVDQIAMVDAPGSNFSKYYDDFIREGLVLSPQTFLGIQNGELFPNDLYNITNNISEHGIAYRGELFKKGFSCKEKKEILCHSKRMLIAPNGDVFKCHYHLYSGRNRLFSIKDLNVPDLLDYAECHDFGFCNPCDYPSVSFRELEVEFWGLLKKTFPKFDTAVLSATIDRFGEETLTFISDMLKLLYTSADPVWDLYNNLDVRQVINDFIGTDPIDNTNALFLAQLDFNLFRMFPNGVNVYRILDTVQLCKYVAAVAYLGMEHLKKSKPIIEDFCEKEDFDSIISDFGRTMVTILMKGVDGSDFRYIGE